MEDLEAYLPLIIAVIAILFLFMCFVAAMVHMQ